MTIISDFKYDNQIKKITVISRTLPLICVALTAQREDLDGITHTLMLIN